MLDAARKAHRFLSGRSANELGSDELLSLALTHLLEIVGEAAKRVSEGFRLSHPEIPWGEAARTRDRLVHGYMSVDLEVVWEIVTKDFPPLISRLEALVEAEES